MVELSAVCARSGGAPNGTPETGRPRVKFSLGVGTIFEDPAFSFSWLAPFLRSGVEVFLTKDIAAASTAR